MLCIANLSSFQQFENQCKQFQLEHIEAVVVIRYTHNNGVLTMCGNFDNESK